MTVISSYCLGSRDARTVEVVWVGEALDELQFSLKSQSFWVFLRLTSSCRQERNGGQDPVASIWHFVRAVEPPFAAMSSPPLPPQQRKSECKGQITGNMRTRNTREYLRGGESAQAAKSELVKLAGQPCLWWRRSRGHCVSSCQASAWQPERRGPRDTPGVGGGYLERRSSPEESVSPKFSPRLPTE